MSLFGAIQLANNSLRANQIGLQVTGQNIANANTPGYIREEAVFSPAPTQRIGNLLLGLGVEITGVVQKIDTFLEERLRGATSERSANDIQSQTYQELEGVYGELGDGDLSTALTTFFNSIQDLASQPENRASRQLAVLRGGELTSNINRLASRTGQMRFELNDRVGKSVDDINRLVEEIRGLNLRIGEAEGSDVSASDAVGLRDQRQIALTNLARLINIKTYEQPTGMVSVFVGGEYLVLDGIGRSVKAVEHSDRGMQVLDLHLAETDVPLDISAGEVAGLIGSRDDILGGFLDTLDNFSATLINEFNRVYSTGQGLTGYQSLTSEWAADSPTAALDAVGLPFTPTNGSFELQLYNKSTGLTETTDVAVDLNGLDGDTTLASLAAAIDAVDGISASVDSDNHLVVQSDSANVSIAFGDDSSGILAALGINTFFSGNDARTIGVSNVVAADPTKFAASREGVGEDSKMAVELGGLLQKPLESQNGLSISGVYEQMTAGLAQASSVSQAVAQGSRVFEDQLHGQSLAVSGVSIDEEVLKMMRYQRSFQASAKYIATLDQLLEMLVAL